MPEDHTRAEPAIWYLPSEGMEAGVARNEVLKALQTVLNASEASSFTVQAVDGYVAVIIQKPERFTDSVRASIEKAALACGLKFVGEGPAINDRNHWSRPVSASV